jgi:hypothetical protein
LRSDLLQFARSAGDNGTDINLDVTLDAICSSVRATYGVLLGLREGQLKLVGKYNWDSTNITIPLDLVKVDDIISLEVDTFPQPFSEAALLVPLYKETSQVGALILGQPVNGVHYAQTDIDMLLYPSDHLSELLYASQQEREYYSQVAGIIKERKSKQVFRIERIGAKQVEDALRKMADYAYLGNHPLSKMNLVDEKLDQGKTTHIDRGKALYKVLEEGIEKLRPDKESPRDPPPREWHAYYILRDAYVDEVQNRDIMSRLYISEGTFNRTRRAAIRAVTQALEEMGTALDT